MDELCSGSLSLCQGPPWPLGGLQGQNCFDNNTKRSFTFVNFTVPCVYGNISQRLNDLWYCNQLIRLSAEADMIWEYSSLSTLERDTKEIYKTVKKMLFSFIVCILENSYFS